MLVQIFKLGETDVIHTFSSGTHIVGRGPDLQCNDKRVSRNHATIEITEDVVKLTSTHINPCFLKAANSKTITVLSKDSTKELDDEDSFALLPDDFWFKIKLVKAEEIQPTNGVSKRCSNEFEEDGPPDKKMKIEDEDAGPSVENGEIQIDNNVGGAKLDGEKQEQEKNAPADATHLNQNVEDGVVKNETEESPQNEETTVKEEDSSNLDSVDNNKPTTSTSRRERCWYGAQCYRKNPVHRKDYTHPGDSDFESDPDDNRPSCSFGAQCYRKNKLHRRDYKHPPREPPSKKKRNRKKVDRLNVANSEEMRDLSDSEDPYMDYDDSDEYTGESDEDDSDWEDSQEVDEDKDNVKRLVKEANRFVKK